MPARIKRDDQVIVISGKDRGKKGKVLRVDPANDKVIVLDSAEAQLLPHSQYRGCVHRRASRLFRYEYAGGAGYRRCICVFGGGNRRAALPATPGIPPDAFR